MAEFEEKLNSILGNQEAMSQIMALARSLSGEQPASVPEALPDNPEASGGAPEDPPPATPSEPALPDLSALMDQLDPKMLQMGMDVMHQLQNTDSRSTALLNALRPFLREERRARLDRALQLSRMIKIIRTATGALGGKEGERV